MEKDKTTLSTLSYNKDRTKNVDMFYSTTDFFDKHQYNALFNHRVPKDILDDDGNKIGTGLCYKYKIDNKLKNDIKVASEDSGAKEFMKLYKKDRDFYNFVQNRMSDYFLNDRYKFKGYREAKEVINKMKEQDYTPTSDDLTTIYRIFNYIIPYDGGGTDFRGASDVAKQRAKFFKELKKDGYGAVLDTNDAIYGGYKAKSPIIVFDMEQLMDAANVRETKLMEKNFSKVVLFGRKALGL